MLAILLLGQFLLVQLSTGHILGGAKTKLKCHNRKVHDPSHLTWSPPQLLLPTCTNDYAMWGLPSICTWKDDKTIPITLYDLLDVIIMQMCYPSLNTIASDPKNKGACPYLAVPFKQIIGDHGGQCHYAFELGPGIPEKNHGWRFKIEKPYATSWGYMETCEHMFEQMKRCLINTNWSGKVVHSVYGDGSSTPRDELIGKFEISLVKVHAGASFYEK